MRKSDSATKKTSHCPFSSPQQKCEIERQLLAVNQMPGTQLFNKIGPSARI